jgi:heme/copper-type cytochrome/quinol oxidase subunit 2
MFIHAKKIYWILTFSLLSFLPTGLAYAQGVSPSDTAVIPNPLGPKNNTIESFITLLLNTLFPIATLVSVFFMIYAGFLMVTAGGNEEKLSKARQAFLWTVIGIAILLGAKVLSVVICGTINQLGTMQLSCTVK